MCASVVWAGRALANLCFCAHATTHADVSRSGACKMDSTLHRLLPSSRESTESSDLLVSVHSGHEQRLVVNYVINFDDYSLAMGREPLSHGSANRCAPRCSRRLSTAATITHLSVAATLKFRFPETTAILAHAEIFSNRRSISAVPSAI